MNKIKTQSTLTPSLNREGHGLVKVSPVKGRFRGILVLVLLLFLVISVHQVLALSESQKRMPQDVAMNGVGYSGVNVSVGSSTITLGKDSNWWDLNWNYKKQLTVKNLGSSQVGQNATVQVTVDTTSLSSGTTKLQSDLDDLRIVYSVGATPVFAEVPRSINQTIGQTNVVTIAFPLQASIGAMTTDSNYYLYYGNSTVNGPSWPKEKGLSFDGTSDYMNGSLLPLRNGSFTMEAWFKLNTLSQNQHIIGSGSDYYRVYFTTAQRRIYFVTYNNGAVALGTGTTISDSGWHHVATTFDGTTKKIYLDGVLENSVGASVPTGDDYIHLGMTTTNAAWPDKYYLNGSIDEARVWNRTLTQSEIQSRMNRELDSSDPYWSNLKSYWKLNDGSGQTVIDSSGNGNNGTLGLNSGVSTDDPVWFNTNLAYSVGSKTATFVAPLNGTTTALVAGGTGVATAATGALRYTTKGAMSFDGKNDYVGIGNTISSTTNNYSISMWIYPQSAAGNQLFFDSRPAANMPRNIRVWTVGSQIFLGLGGYGVTQINLPANWINNWHQVTQTFNWNGSNYEIKGYIDGAYIGTDTNATGTIIFNSNFSVGMGYVSSTQTFGKAKIDEVAILDKVLSASEVSKLYNSGSPSPITSDSSTKLLYHFDENGDDPRLSGKVFDASGNNNNGTIYGAKYADGIVPAGELSHQGVMLEEGTTNVVTNPSFESSISTGWINKITQNYGNGTTDADGNIFIGSTSVNDIFFYDTTKDADGGAWRNNATAQASSWYIEGFSSIRGKKKEFPEKAYIIATNSEVAIVDAVENKLWMRFSRGGYRYYEALGGEYAVAVTALNGKVYLGTTPVGELTTIDFKLDQAHRSANNFSGPHNDTIANRNLGSNWTNNNSYPYVVNRNINDVSVANIGGTTFVAVGTDGGVSVINENAGTVVNIGTTGVTGGQVCNSVVLANKRMYYVQGSSFQGRVYYIDYSSAAWTAGTNSAPVIVYTFGYGTGTPEIINSNSINSRNSLFVTSGTSTIDGTSNTIYVSASNGLAVVQEKQGDETNSSIKLYDKDKVTEEMVGDIRGMWSLFGEVGVNTEIGDNTSHGVFPMANNPNNLQIGNTGRAWGGSGGSNGEIQSADYERAIRGNGLKFDGVGDYLKQKVYQTESGSAWGPATNNFSFANGQAFFRSGEVLGSEAITNTSFETLGSGGTDVFSVWTELAGTGVIADEQSVVNSGSHAAKLTDVSGSDPVLYSQKSGLTAGQEYKLTFYTRGDGANSSIFYVWDGINNAYIKSSISTGITGTSYQLVTSYFTIPTNCTAITFGFRTPTVSGAVVYIDDVSLKLVTSPNLSTYKGSDIGSFTPYMLVVKDTGGSQAWGYIGSASTGETLGSELVTNGTMEADANWSSINTVETNERVGTTFYDGSYSRHVVDNVPSYGGIASTAFSMTTGKLYKTTFFAKVVSGTAKVVVTDGAGGSSWMNYQLLTNSAWTQYTLYGVAGVGGTSAAIRFYNNSTTTTGVEFYVDNVSVKEVTDTQIDGVHILSTRNGSTKSWAGVDTGFNYNDTSYTYEVRKTDFQITGNITIGAWVNAGSLVLSSEHSIISKMTDYNKNRAFNLEGRGDSGTHVDFRIWSGTGTGGSAIGTGYIYTTGTWYFVVGVCDTNSATCKIYVNGEEKNSGAWTGNSDTMAPLIIGSDAAVTRRWHGSIDEPFVTAEALTAGQISDMYQKGLAAKNSSYSQNLAGTSSQITSVSVSADGKYILASTTGGGVSMIKNGRTGDYVNSDSLINSFTTATTPALLNNNINAIAVVGAGATPTFIAGSAAGGVSVINGNLLTASQTTTAPYFRYGSAALKMDNLANPFDAVYSIGSSFGVGTTMALSAYVYSDGSSITSSDVQLYAQNQMVGTSYEDIGGGWWRMSNVLTVGTTISQNYGVQVKAGKTIYVDGVQMENNKSYPTTYTDGSLGTGYSWTGTANNSLSSRTATNLQYATANNLSANAGTISMWFKPNWNGDDHVSHYFFDTYGSRMRLQKYSTDNKLYFDPNFTESTSRRVVSTNGLTSTDIVKDRWNNLVIVYDQSRDLAKLYLNGNVHPTTTLGTGWTLPTNWTNFCVGQCGSNLMNSFTSDYRIFDQTLSDGEVVDLYNQGLMNHQNGDESATKYASSGTYISPVVDLNANGSWGTVPISFSDVGGSVAYWTRTSTDNSTWGNWVPTSGSTIVSDPRRYFQWRADLSGNQLTTPTVSGMVVSYVEDTQAPSNIGATDMTVYTAVGSTQTVATATWNNFEKPVFNWIGATDVPSEGQSVSGVNKYHVLLSKDIGSTPVDGKSNSCYLSTTDSDRNFKVGINPSGCKLTNGVWYLRMQVEDNSGNLSVPVTLFTDQYDTDAPSAPASVSTTTIGYSANNVFTFFWPAVTDVGPAGLKGYEYKTGVGDTSIWGDWQFTTETSISEVPAYTEGANIFYVRAVDNAGNYSQATTNNGTASYYYNQSAPQAPQNVKIGPETSSDNQAATNSFTVSWDKPQKYSGDIAKYYYCVNCTPSKNSMTETTADETVLRKLSNMPLATQQGKNTFYLVAEDNNVNNETGHGNVNFDAATSVEFYAQTLAPAAPTNVTISDASDRSLSKWRLTLAWDVGATSVGSSMVDHFDVYRSTDGNDYSKIGTITNMAFTDSGLSQSQKYYYKIRAVDNAGALSLFSGVVISSPEGRYADPPSMGGTPVVTAGSSTATIKWSTSRNSYGTVEYGTASSYGQAVSESTLTTDHSVKLTGLASGQSYHFRVMDMDEAGLVGYDRSEAYSADYTFTTLNTADVSDITVSDQSLDSAVVSWKTASMANSQIDYGLTSEYGTRVMVPVTADASVHSYKLTGLTHSTTYHFKLSGKTVDETNIASQDITFSTLTFPLVTAYVLKTDQNAGGTVISLAWASNVPTSSVVEYNAAEAKDGSLTTDKLAKLSQEELAKVSVVLQGEAQQLSKAALEGTHIMKIDHLKDGAIYIIRLRGRDKYGNEAVSDPIRYVTGKDTRPPVISNVSVEAQETGSGKAASTQIIVSWDTDEPATTQVLYGQGVGSEYPLSTQEENGLTSRHTVVIRDVQPTTSYHLQIVSKDETANVAKTGDLIAVTPAVTASALDVVLTNLEDVFGFLKL